MKVKGTAVKSIREFVKSNYPDQYRTWINALPEASKEIMESMIRPSAWYPTNEAIIEPTTKAGELFFTSTNEAAYEMGRYSSKTALKGIYQIFIKISTPAFIISRAASYLSTYYTPGNVDVIDKSSKHVVLIFSNFGLYSDIIFQRIMGWIHNTFESVNAKNIKIKKEAKPTKKDPKAVMVTVNWD